MESGLKYRMGTVMEPGMRRIGMEFNVDGECIFYANQLFLVEYGLVDIKLLSIGTHQKKLDLNPRHFGSIDTTQRPRVHLNV